MLVDSSAARLSWLDLLECTNELGVASRRSTFTRLFLSRHHFSLFTLSLYHFVSPPYYKASSTFCEYPPTSIPFYIRFTLQDAFKMSSTSSTSPLGKRVRSTTPDCPPPPSPKRIARVQQSPADKPASPQFVTAEGLKSFARQLSPVLKENQPTTVQDAMAVDFESATSPKRAQAGTRFSHCPKLTRRTAH